MMSTAIRIEEIAGYMPERYVWQMLYEVSSLNNDSKVKINPSNILWDERHFSLAQADKPIARKNDYQYEAPEVSQGNQSEKSLVWSLAATAFYMHLGCNVFNGRGGKAQEADSPIPYLRKELRDLSELLAQCLNYDAQKRPSLDELNHRAKAQLDKCLSLPHSRKRKGEKSNSVKDVAIDDFWREEMNEY